MTTKTIYATPFSNDDNLATGPSIDSGFTSIDEVVEAVGDDHLYICKRFVTYSEIVFSDFKFRIDIDINNQ